MVMAAGHLGGYIKGGDPDTYYPELWDWFVGNTASVADHLRVLDIGCGEGHSVSYFAELGCEVVGVDGVPQDHPLVAHHDYTTGPWVPPGRFDFCWCCEFVEHVEEQYAANYMASFASCQVVAITHAEPGQAGYHHVNCQDDEYWIGLFGEHGFQLDHELTQEGREVSARHPRACNYFARTGLVFSKAGS